VDELERRIAEIESKPEPKPAPKPRAVRTSRPKTSEAG
jgi:hypothetical protein